MGVEPEVSRYHLDGESLTVIVEHRALGWAIGIPDSDKWIAERIDDAADALARAKRYVELFDQAHELQERAGALEAAATLIAMGRQPVDLDDDAVADEIDRAHANA